MVKASVIVQYAVNLAYSGMGVDKDGAWGTQCADLPCFIVKNWWGIDLWGNAIDLLDSAAQYNFEVHRLPSQTLPKAGAIFVMAQAGHGFGHTGLVIEDSDGVTMRTIEQNIDGNWDSLTVGGPARFNTRDFTGVIGWFYPPYDKGSETVAYAPTSAEITLIPEQGTFTVEKAPINVRRAPNLQSEVVGVYQPGQSVRYDSKGSANGYRWISYVGASGERNYMAIGQTDEAGNRISLWGTVK